MATKQGAANRFTDSVKQDEKVVKVVPEIIIIDRKVLNCSFYKVIFSFVNIFKLCGQVGGKKRRVIAK